MSTPNAIEALSEALRRIAGLKSNTDSPLTRWDAYHVVLAYRSELTAACVNRISGGVDEWEEMQREAEQDKQAQDEAYHALRCAGQPR